MGYVYFTYENGSNNVKIGKENKLNTRIKQQQTGNPNRLETRGYIETTEPLKLEACLHKLFADYRLEGEWFFDTGIIGNYVKQHGVELLETDFMAATVLYAMACGNGTHIQFCWYKKEGEYYPFKSRVQIDKDLTIAELTHNIIVTCYLTEMYNENAPTDVDSIAVPDTLGVFCSYPLGIWDGKNWQASLIGKMLCWLYQRRIIGFGRYIAR